jgi:hypothetical protein
VADVPVQCIGGPAGRIVVLQEGPSLPLDLVRTFVVLPNADGGDRGHHAHRACGQLMVCLRGVCDVTCDDGSTRRSWRLADQTTGLYVPPSIWAEQRYGLDSMLLVACDRPYEEDDYIRDYGEFLRYRGLKE